MTSATPEIPPQPLPEPLEQPLDPADAPDAVEREAVAPGTLRLPGESQSRQAWHVDLQDETATAALAVRIAEILRADDLVTLSGDLGSGKSTFARALLRHMTGDAGLEVPSPTFTLMQVYAGPDFPMVHADLYRIKQPGELADLGWEEASEGALVLVEWAERAGGTLPLDRLDIAFYMDLARGPGYREAVLRGHGSFAPRLASARAIGEVLGRSGWMQARRDFMTGDASARAYERLTKPDGAQAVLMIMPARPPGPPIRFGKSYAAIARLALDIKPFLAMAAALRAQGLSAPEIFAHDAATGVAVLEDLGLEGIADGKGMIFERYAQALDVLAKLHASDLPDVLPMPGGDFYRIPAYDPEAMLIEVEQLLDWYVPHVARIVLSSGTRAIFLNLWRKLLDEVVPAKPTWTLRDFHSPNLIWQSRRSGPARIGLIDFQDCAMGHPAYDVAALLQDARVTIADADEIRLLGHYARARREADASFDMSAFARAYAILGAQRNTKILGIFARLDKRDAKPAYLAHLPRIIAYLSKDLAHPALAQIKTWFDIHLPQVLGPGAAGPEP